MEALKFGDYQEHGLGEPKLIKRILEGEKDLYEILVRRNNQKLYRVVRAYLKEDAEIQDVMQESYLKAYIKLHQFRLDATFSTWLIRIAINEALARLRQKRRVCPVNGAPDPGSGIRFIDIPDEGQPNPHHSLVRNEIRLRLAPAIDRLALKFRTG